MSGQNNFPPEFFKQNRERLYRTLKTDAVIVLTANGLLQRGADSSYPFIQDANFWYLTGINDPDISLVIDGNREFLIAPTRELTRATFDGQIDEHALAEVSGVRDIVNEAAGWTRLDSLLKRTPKLATPAPAPSFIEQYGMYANPARSRFLERIERHLGELELFDLRPTLATMRMIKQPIEIQALRSAIKVTCETLSEVLAARPGTYEYEYQLEADVSRGFRFRGADGHAFEPIVASGPRACTLHYVSNDSRITRGEMVILDVGASVNGYAADITRVYATAKPNKRQQEIFAAVKDTQAYAISLLGTGVYLKSYEAKVVRYCGSKLKQLGLIKKTDQRSVRRYFPHATSHFLGLNVHDVGDYRKPLKAGTVLTVEPGIYVSEEGIGVRLEDDILITEKGAEVLSAGLPAELQLT